jgi:hypothetical protein
MKIAIRLEFEYVFPEEEEKDILYYLAKVSSETLLKIIGYFNTKSLPNFDNFFSNPKVAKDIYNRVFEYTKKQSIRDKPEVISQQGSLKLTELILANKASLIENNNDNNNSIDDDEINIFKAFLIINSELNRSQVLNNTSEVNYEKLVDYSIIFSFPISDLAIFENDDIEFLKSLYATIVKVELLFNFLNSKKEFEKLKTSLIQSFNTNNEKDFFKEMKYLFGKLLELKTSNNYIFKVDNNESEKFINSMISDDINTDVDFTYIKINPLYKLEDKTYSIINYFYVVDKFYRSTKYKIKEIYEADENLSSQFGDFLGFFNKEFSENFLMKNILDEIFYERYFIKKNETENELDGEPDYYLRHNNRVFIFENKDVWIAKSIKSSGDIEKINKALKQKFLGDNNHKVGIGQLINTIEELLSGNFRFDNYVNQNKNLKIYPILLVHDRIFQSLGINYRLNQWYLESVKSRLENKYNPSNIKSLTVIDIDTMILWSPHLKKNDKNFREIIDSHLTKLNKYKKTNIRDYEYGLEFVNRRLTERLTSISHREIPDQLPSEILINKFKDVLQG